MSGVGGGVNDALDPLLDLSLPEEQELPFMTVATASSMPSIEAIEEEDNEDEDDENRLVSVVHMESRVHVSYLETMFAVGIDGCKQIRQVLDGVIKAAGRKILAGEAETMDEDE
jgi:exosome complex component RRP41